MRLSRRMAYAAQMALVLALGAGLVAMVRAQSAAHATKTRAPAVAPATAESPPGTVDATPAEVAGVLMTRTPAAGARGGMQVGEVARQASGDLDRYGGQGLERAAADSPNADDGSGARATHDTRTRASPEG